MNIVFDQAASVIRGWKPSEDFSMSAVYAPEPFGTESSFSGATVNDLTYNGRTTTGSKSKYNVAVTTALSNPPVTLDSETPALCAVAPDGTVTLIADGYCVVRATGQTGSRKLSMHQATSGGQTYYDEVTARAAGSLRKYLYDQQIAALAGVTPGAAAQRAHLYPNNIAAGNGTTVTMGGAFGPVNPDNFLFATKSGFDGLPADLLASVLATPGATVESRVWLTPHHYITGLGAAHGTQPGASYRLVGLDGIVRYSATPWAGTLAKVLPADWQSRMPPALGTVGNEIACWARLFNTYDGKSDATAERRWVQPVSFATRHFSATDVRYPYQRQKTSGSPLANGNDSGSPVFCGINGDLVILSHVAYQGSVGSDDYGTLAGAINTAMNELATYYGDAAAGTYAVQTVDLSGFTNYA